MDLQQLANLEKSCVDVMRSDQFRFQKRLRQYQQQLKQGKKLNFAELEKLVQSIHASLRRRQQRAAQLPRPTYPESLPISEKRAEIAAAIKQHQVIVIAGETGSGKTTQIPKICLEVGRGVSGMIGCTQPRRIAARTIAYRVAEELDTELGKSVGYKVRFSDYASEDSYIKFMTDGILLAETQNDHFLDTYDTIIIDEAHERSLNIDFLLGYLKRLLPKRRDLKLIITSATIDTARFAQHFANAPIIEVSGRTYPVELRYHPLSREGEGESERDLQQGILDAVDEVTLHDRNADILIFLPTERDIRETTDNLHKHKLGNTVILPLYARLSAAEQNRVFKPGAERRIVLATNVAETSLTVPRIKAVIDTGLARMSRYSVRSKVQRLPIEKIAQSSANQRMGRCGRIAPGLCIRLYAPDDFDNRPAFTDPEILRTSLAAVILQMLGLRLGDISAFPFIDPPPPKMINDGYTLLAELGAVDEQRRITEIGRQLAKLPIDPRLARMLLAAHETRCLHEVLIITSALSIQDPRERPLNAQQAADTAQQIFVDERSDFLSFIKLWDAYHKQAKHLSNNKLCRWCQAHFLSYLRMREWHDIHQQLQVMIKDSGWKLNDPLSAQLFNVPTATSAPHYDAIHRSLLTGLLGNIAQKTREEHFLGARGLKLYVFPGSGLFKKPPKWLMAAELVETSKLFARCVAKINPDWIEKLAQGLCKSSYSEPHWEKRAAQVAAFEKVTLYGLTIVSKRKINYGPLDPALSREIFIRQALVDGDFHSQAPFFQHNRSLINEVEMLEHKARRQDILVNEQKLYAFYAAKLPDGIYSGHAFEKWRKAAERDAPQMLFLSRDDLIANHSQVDRTQFPDYLHINGVDLPLRYHFEPGHAHDGVTLTLPTALLNQVKPAMFDWLVPGLLEEKITELLRGLPKQLRRQFVPVPEVARKAMLVLEDHLRVSFDTAKTNGLIFSLPPVDFFAEFEHLLQRHLGKPLPAIAWESIELPTYLQMNFRLIDAEDNTLTVQRDLTHLQAEFGTQASRECRREVADKSGLEQMGLKNWSFDALPQQVTRPLNGVDILGFPTLLDRETHVDLQVLDDPEVAQREFKKGLTRLFWLQLPTKKLVKQMPIDHQLCLQYMKIGHCEQLKQDMLLTLIEAEFLREPIPRERTAFEQRLAQGKQTLLTVAYTYATQLGHIITEYNQVTPLLSRARSPAMPEIKQHLQHLIYEGFVRDVPVAQIPHLPRYLKAVRLRLERLPQSPQKDERKAQQLAPFWQYYWEKYQKEGETAQLAEFRWLLEELRVSLFAQELKTACPVSVQRVEKIWREMS